MPLTHWLENQNLSVKVSLIIILAATGFIVISFWSIYKLKEQLINERIDRTRHLTAIIIETLEHDYNDAKENNISMEIAKEQALIRIENIRYDEGQYFWINESKKNPRVLMHPYIKDIVNIDLKEHSNSRMAPLFQEFADAAKSNKDGATVNYIWPSPGANFEEAESKISYVREFVPWGLVVGTGVYIDDINKYFQKTIIGFLVLIPIGIFILMFMSNLLSNMVSKPLKSLVNCIDLLMKNVNEVTVPFLKRKDEVGHIARALERFRIQSIENKALEKENAINQKALEEERSSRIQQLKFLSEHDELTSLLNRHGFILSAEEKLNLAPDRSHYLLYIDLDHFKEVNDTLGHTVGDKLLVEIANRFKSIIGESGTIGRIGGDEFAILMKPNIDENMVTTLCDRLLDEVSKPLLIDCNSIRIGCSIGFTQTLETGSATDNIIRCADIALYEAKALGRNTFLKYTPDMSSKLVQEKFLRQELEDALSQNGGLYMVYQPQIDCRTNQLVGCEALCRWQHNTLGLISPEVFIPLAEKKGLIRQLTRHIHDLVLQQIATWKTIGFHPKQVSINFSALDFLSPDSAVQFLKLLDSAGIDGAVVECEITESVLIDNIQASVHAMNTLKDKGVEITIDDFGTGYSSLSYIHLFPISKIKIDRSFITEMDNNRQSQKIVSAIIKLAEGLGIDLVAEGIEREDQLEFLKNEGCYVIQGHLYSKPLTAGEFSEWAMQRAS